MNKPQILFVEDDTAVGNLIATTLETQNYQFRRAKNGAQGVMDALSYRCWILPAGRGRYRHHQKDPLLEQYAHHRGICPL